jgi:hypothetical protein
MLKPILFSTPMVQAIIAGQKTMTRRVIKQSIVDNFVFDALGVLVGSYREGMAEAYPTVDDAPIGVGDVMWVRETWMPETEQRIHTGGYIYRATDCPEPDGDDKLKWRPSIFMPKEAARIFLRVTAVRAERLQDITVVDVMAEGLSCDNDINNPDPQTHEGIRNWNLTYAQFLFHELWDKLNAARGYGWDKNPWVWVYTFERICHQETKAG